LLFLRASLYFGLLGADTFGRPIFAQTAPPPANPPAQSSRSEYLWYEAESMQGFSRNERHEPVANPSWMNPLRPEMSRRELTEEKQLSVASEKGQSSVKLKIAPGGIQIV
jgi:hypothetical protein